jgi:hypothetical protein
VSKDFASALTIFSNSLSDRSVFIRFTSEQVTTTLDSSPGFWCSNSRYRWSRHCEESSISRMPV